MLALGFLALLLDRNGHHVLVQVFAASLMCTGLMVIVLGDIYLRPRPHPTEAHRERVLNGLDGLQEAKEALAAVTYDHPNVIRARLHVDKAIECLERRERRLTREARPKKVQAASVGGGSK